MPPPNNSPPDDWTTDGSKITDPNKIDVIRTELEKSGPVLVKHWHYRGSRAPDHVAFDDIDDYLDYLKAHARPGDAFDVWAIQALLSGVAVLAEGKFPDDQGKVPRKGAY